VRVAVAADALIDERGIASPSVARPEAGIPENRFNDGKCDRAGRFWAASMNDRESGPTGHLWRLDDMQSHTHMESGFVIGNGLGWSPDDRVFYFTDSTAHRIYAYDFDIGSGSIRNRRVFAAVPEDAGLPDGELCLRWPRPRYALCHTARLGLDAKTLAAAPDSGSVLAVKTGSRGLPEAAFPPSR
jgi:sugar lactone lactonase YvrE